KLAPASTWAGPVLVIARSATARTEDVKVARLIFGDVDTTSGALSVAALVTVPPASGDFTVRVMVACAVLLSVPPEQVAVLVVVLNAQVKLTPLALTAVMVAPSSWFVSWIWVAVLRSFPTRRSSDLKLAPASTWAGPVLVIARSATART